MSPASNNSVFGLIFLNLLIRTDLATTPPEFGKDASLTGNGSIWLWTSFVWRIVIVLESFVFIGDFKSGGKMKVFLAYGPYFYLIIINL